MHRSRSCRVKPEKSQARTGLSNTITLETGLDVSDVRQTATCGELAKVLVGVALIIGLVIILRKAQNPVIMWLIAALEQIEDNARPASARGTFAKNDATHLRR
jgi:hypothetical protein